MLNLDNIKIDMKSFNKKSIDKQIASFNNDTKFANAQASINKKFGGINNGKR